MTRKGTPKVDSDIARIIDKHTGDRRIDPDAALALFTELSEVGGEKFQWAMKRVKDIIGMRLNAS